jgi:hypothetical protein
VSIDHDLPAGGGVDVTALDGLAPGSVLVEALEGVDPSVLEGAEAVDYLRACARARNRAAARFLTAVHEAGRSEDGTRVRRALVDEFSGDEVAVALGWSRAMAGRWLELADDLHRRLIEVQAAMASGVLDEGKARVFSEWTRDLADDHAHHVCRVVLPEAPGLPIGALIERIQQVAGALDPEWAARRERAAEKRARVVASRNASGTANVSGCDLPMTSAVAIMARVEALAWAVRRGGVVRRVAWLRAKVYERLLDGFAAGLTDDVLVPLLIADLGAQPDDEDAAGAGAAGGDGPDGRGPDDGSPGEGSPDDEPCPEDTGRHDDPGPEDQEPGEPGSGAPDPDPDDDGPQGSADVGPRDDHRDDQRDDPPDTEGDAPGVSLVELPRPGAVRQGTVEVRLRLSTALGFDDMPALVPGWGTVLAGTARTLLDRHRDGEWRVVLTDDDGRLRRVLLPRRRPRPPGPRRGPGSTAIVELAAPATLLAALTPDDHGPWAALLHELQARLGEGDDGPPDSDATDSDAARRHPLAEIDRWVRVRDRQCVAPGCRRPAYASDLDHTVDHARGGPSLSWNCGVWCRHHHRAKHDGGWRVTQPAPGRFHITTRAGARHAVAPPRITEPLPPAQPADQPRPLPEHEQHPPDDHAEDDETPLARAVRSDPSDAHRAAAALVDPPPPF